jgi:8-oxo-dGTP diphosphatase
MAHTPSVAFCPSCGSPAPRIDDGVPTCDRHGPQWALVRNAPCADVIVTNGDSVLLARRAQEPYAGLWELPGGYQNRGEHPADAARREVREELGIEVELTELLGIYLDPYDDTIVQVTVFVGTPVGDRVHLDRAEVSECDWFAASKLPLPEQMAGGHRRRLDDWVKTLRGGRSSGLGLDG